MCVGQMSFHQTSVSEMSLMSASQMSIGQMSVKLIGQMSIKLIGQMSVGKMFVLTNGCWLNVLQVKSVRWSSAACKSAAYT